MTSVLLTDETLAAADLVILITDHSAYDYPWIATQAKLIHDSRNAFKGIKAGHIFQA